MSTVREPIQVYLTPEERAELDRAAQILGVSRSEVLRRGIRAMGDTDAYAGALRGLADSGWVRPAKAGPGAPPPSAPTASLDELLRELAGDRNSR